MSSYKMGFSGPKDARSGVTGGRRSNKFFSTSSSQPNLNNASQAVQPPATVLAHLAEQSSVHMYSNSNPYQSQSSTSSSLQLIQQHNSTSTLDSLYDTTNQSFNRYAVAPDEKSVFQAEVGDRLSEIISQIDEDSYSLFGLETTITLSRDASSPPPPYHRSNSFPAFTPDGSERSLVPARRPRPSDAQQTRTINVLSKLSYYSNSRLPTTLPPFRVFVSTYQLLCLAALSSSNAYGNRQNVVQGEELVLANARIGTKAMVVKSVTCADEKTIVIAVRGTSVLSLRDWNTNLHVTPESPAGFLDDDGNYCHSGFLRVARAMVKPIATRLRHLLEENPNRLDHSLLFTGHSAGGAVASLLYVHMLSEQVKSELTTLSDCFKRLHCVTFGAPPISLLPLKKPSASEHKMKRYLFYSFINEGDPVVRAERSYIISLVDLLLTTPSQALGNPPRLTTNKEHKLSESSGPENPLLTAALPLLRITNRGLFTGPKKQKQNHASTPLPESFSRPFQSKPSPTAATSKPTWNVPPATLSNAGRLIVLRGPEPAAKQKLSSSSQVDLIREFEQVRAYTVADEQLRQVVFGDPLMHAMDVYRRRIEALAMKAITGREAFH